MPNDAEKPVLDASFDACYAAVLRPDQLVLLGHQRPSSSEIDPEESSQVAFERPQAVTRGSTPLADALRAVV